jgi:hypothetical protein
MPVSHSFHPEALFEYAEATTFYLREASQRVAEAFVSSVELAIVALVAAPTRWRIIEEPQIRRYVIRAFQPIV